MFYENFNALLIKRLANVMKIGQKPYEILILLHIENEFNKFVMFVYKNKSWVLLLLFICKYLYVNLYIYQSWQKKLFFFFKETQPG